MGPLHTKTIGQGPEQLVFLHGVFGQGKNFGTVAKLIADRATCLLVDLPNHGRSPWTDYFDYGLFADLVADELVEQGAGRTPVTLIGHSMGGKVAMQLALSHPQLLKRLVVIDMSPVDRGDAAEFEFYAETLNGLDLTSIRSRADADAALRHSIPNAATRSFLLQNLHRAEGSSGWRWLPNLRLLRNSMAQIAGWPDQDGQHWTGPVLWLAGERSKYIEDAHLPAMRALFPNVRLEVIADAGHWVHADQPHAVADALRRFLASRPQNSGSAEADLLDLRGTDRTR